MAVQGSEEPETSPKKRKRESDDAKRKLLVNERVEVRSVDEGFRGSWHSGIVVASDKKRLRHVSYDHLLTDDESGKLVEVVPVSPFLDGDGLHHRRRHHHHHRGNIRPLLPRVPVRNWDLHYGLCVEAMYLDAWWEGVVFDHKDGSPERRVFFPDLGDELVMGIDSLRVTHDWDEATGEWKRRGSWVLLELVEEFERSSGDILPVSVTQIWYDVRQNRDFEDVREWTRWDDRALWKKMVSEACDLYLKFFAEELCRRLKLRSSVPVDSSSVFTAGDGSESAEIRDSHGRLNSAVNCDVSAVNVSSGSSVLSHSKEALGCVVTQVSHGLKSPDDITVRPNHSECEDTKKWQLATAEMVPGAEFCPDSVDRYVQCSYGELRGAKTRLRVQRDVWKHLSYLGWKIEYSYENRMPRKRYTQPGSGKCLYSLIKVCEHLKESAGDGASLAASRDEPRRQDGSSSVALHLEQPQESRDPDRFLRGVVIPSSSGPILEYCRLEGQRVDPEILRILRLKVQEQLVSEGWVISTNYYKSNGKSIVTFRSPTGKLLYSLISACKYSRDEMPKCAYPPSSRSTLIRFTVGKKGISANNTQSFDLSGLSFQENLVQPNAPMVKGIRKARKKREGSVLDFATHMFDAEINVQARRDVSQNGSERDGKRKQTKGRDSKLRKTSAAFVDEKRDGRDDKRGACVLRSSKCVQEVVVPNSSHRNPRSILSWLIDNNVLLPRSKVRYINRNDNLILGEGKVTRSGIKCSCCSKLFALSGFAVHAGGKRSKAVANIFLEDGKSILDCQKLVIGRSKKQSFVTESRDRIKSNWRPGENDYICSVCHYGGELMLCDQCPSSFHMSCLGLKDVPEGDWFCPSCCCGKCGEGKFQKDKEHTKDGSILTCSQCAHKYHIGCLRKKHHNKTKSNSGEYWFCNKICKKIYNKLQKLLGKRTTLGADNLTWSLLKSTKTDSCSTVSDEIDAVEKYSKLNVALGVMHECFKPVKESHTRRDLMEDVIFSRESELQRLNFQGFYTVVLARNDELISVATVRVHGKKVAEVPLVGTRFQYRRLGMCRILMNELEKKLMEIGVERLVLPAVPSVLNTWTTSFGFSQMTASERLHFLDFTFLDFQDTIMCQKLLTKIPITELSPLNVEGVQPGYCGGGISEGGRNADIDRSSADSEVYQAEQIEYAQITCQGQPENCADHKADTKICATNALVTANQAQISESRPCVGVTETTTQDFSFNLGKRPYTINFFSKIYQRKKHLVRA